MAKPTDKYEPDLSSELPASLQVTEAELDALEPHLADFIAEMLNEAALAAD